jgi:tetratricopeptide (TPR) repeat protein
MCAGLHRFLSYSGRWDELLALNIQAEQKAKAEGNFYSAGFRAYHQGGIYRVRYQPANVLASAERAQKYWSQAAAAGKREEAMVTELRGWGYRQQDNYQMAIEAFRKTLDLDRTIAAESADVVIDLQALAEAERAAGEYDLAEHDHTEALRIARKLNDVEQVATSAVFLTEFSVRRGEWKAAEKKALNALTLSQGLGRQESIATAGAYLALALANQGRRAEALPHILQAVKIYRRLGGPNLQWAEILLRDCEGGVPAKSLPPDSDRVTPLRPDSSSTRTAAEDDKKRN